jgi:hypothetical protein
VKGVVELLSEGRSENQNAGGYLNNGNPAITATLADLKKEPALAPAVEAMVMLTNEAMQARLGNDAPTCVKFSEEMAGVARARLAKVKADDPEQFKKVLQKYYERHRDRLLTALDKQDDLKGQVPAFKHTLDALIDKPGDVDAVAAQFEAMIQGLEDRVKKSLRINWTLLEGLLRALS